jgi:murein DD-endopeptidase
MARHLEVFLIGLACFLPSAAQRTPLFNSFDLHLISTPERGFYNGEPSLVYELTVTNYSSQDLTLREVSIVEAGVAKPYATFSGDTLAAMIGRGGKLQKGAGRRQIQVGSYAVLFITLTLKGIGKENPTLVHRLGYSAAGSEKPYFAEGAAFRVPTDLPISIGPPLRGTGWTPIYSDAWERGHRRVIYTTKGRARVPGRFAIDWIRVASDGRHAQGEEANAANWYGYGNDVIAVADAVVALAVDDTPDPVAVNPLAVVPIENASGNYVVLDLGQGKFAFYEHLKRGSVAVRTGQRVRKGQTIAAVGYTGQSTGPHLHFHVADSISTLDSDGLPYVLDEFTTVGAFPSADAFARSKPWDAMSPGQVHRDELPAAFTVVAFP